MLATSAEAFAAALFGRVDAAAVRAIDLGAGCWLLHGKLPASLRPSESEVEALWAARPKEKSYFEMYGRLVAVPRGVRLYSQNPLTVRVNGNDFDALTARESPAFVGRLLASVPKCDYNAVVANWYDGGEEYIGWHGDKERQIDADSAPIVSVSLGAERRFQVRKEASRECVFDERLGDGDVVVMGGPGFQHKFKHRVPKMIAQRDGHVGPRMNLTVRKYAAGGPDSKTATKRSVAVEQAPPPELEREPHTARKVARRGAKVS